MKFSSCEVLCSVDSHIIYYKVSHHNIWQSEKTWELTSTQTGRAVASLYILCIFNVRTRRTRACSLFCNYSYCLVPQICLLGNIRRCYIHYILRYITCSYFHFSTEGRQHALLSLSIGLASLSQKTNKQVFVGAKNPPKIHTHFLNSLLTPPEQTDANGRPPPLAHVLR